MNSFNFLPLMLIAFITLVAYLIGGEHTALIGLAIGLGIVLSINLFA